MKVVYIGANNNNYDDLMLSKSAKTSKFGTLTYFKNRIYLVKDQAVADYGTWVSEDGVSYLVLDNDEELRNELSAIKDQIVKNAAFVSTKWKDDAAADGGDECIFVKMDKKAEPVQVNGELRYTIAVYGVFCQKSSGLSFLQMAVQEHQTTKISLLKKAEATASCEIARLNYQPNSLWAAMSDETQQW
jgi:hypothetical protein